MATIGIRRAGIGGRSQPCLPALAAGTGCSISVIGAATAKTGANS